MTKDQNQASAIMQPDVDDLANFIRAIDGNHKMGAGALAESICAWLAATLAQQTEAPKDGAIAQIVNRLRDIALEFHDTQQLRERIAGIIVPVLKAQQSSEKDAK